MARDDFIAAALAGTYQRGLVYAVVLDGLHEPFHFRIVPHPKGMVFEREQLRKIEIDDLLFFGSGSVTGLGGLLRLGGSSGLLLGSRGLTLGHFVPLGLSGLGGSGLVFLGRGSLAGGRLVTLGRAATAVLLRLFGLLVGRGSLLCWGLCLTRLLTGGGEIHHLTSRGGVGIVLAGAGGLLIVLVRHGLFRDGYTGKLRRIRDSLAHFKEGSLPLMLQNELFLYGQLLRPQRGGSGGVGQIGSGVGLLWGLCGSAHIGADGLFIVCHLKTSFVVK